MNIRCDARAIGAMRFLRIAPRCRSLGACPLPLVIAHRGACGYRPELTRGAFLLALEQGAQAIEIDVVASADGELVVRHDPELSHTTDVAAHPELRDRRRLKVVARPAAPRLVRRGPLARGAAHAHRQGAAAAPPPGQRRARRLRVGADPARGHRPRRRGGRRPARGRAEARRPVGAARAAASTSCCVDDARRAPRACPRSRIESFEHDALDRLAARGRRAPARRADRPRAADRPPHRPPTPSAFARLRRREPRREPRAAGRRRRLPRGRARRLDLDAAAREPLPAAPLPAAGQRLRPLRRRTGGGCSTPGSPACSPTTPTSRTRCSATPPAVGVPAYP